MSQCFSTSNLAVNLVKTNATKFITTSSPHYPYVLAVTKSTLVFCAMHIHALIVKIQEHANKCTILQY